MMGRMDDLVQFLRDRYDEEAQVANAATGTEWGDVDPQQPYVIWDVRARQKNRTMMNVGRLATAESAGDRAHIARHDPARVLRDIDAKRQLVKLHRGATLRAGGGAQYFDTTTVCRSCEPSYQFPELSWPCTTLRLLALPYADHPDYRDTWRP